MKKYVKQTDPINVPTGDDRLIEEHFGNASLKYDGCSICRCEIPPRWRGNRKGSVNFTKKRSTR